MGRHKRKKRRRPKKKNDRKLEDTCKPRTIECQLQHLVGKDTFGRERNARYFALGDDALEAGRFDAAIAAFRKARKRLRNSDTIDSTVRTTLLEWSVNGECIAHLSKKEYQSLDSAVRDWITYRVNILSQAGVTEITIPDYSYDAAALMGNAAERFQRHDLAIWLYTQVLEGSPAPYIRDYMHMSLGRIYYSQNGYDTARRHFCAALRLHTDDFKDVLGHYWGTRLSLLTQNPKFAEEFANGTIDVDEQNGQRVFHHARMNLSTLLIGLDSVLATHPDTQENYLAKRADLLSVMGKILTINTPIFTNSVETLFPLIQDPSAVERLALRSTHRVHAQDSSIFKMGDPIAMDNEWFINNYFTQLLAGKLDTAGTTQAQLLLRKSPGAIVPIDPPPIRIASNAVRISSEFIPPHIKEKFPKTRVILGYGRLPGPTLREFIENTSEDRRLGAYKKAIHDLAYIHAMGPMHIVEKMPWVCPSTATHHYDHIRQLLSETKVFSQEDAQQIDAAYGCVARGIGNRQIDSYVKDANPNNWIVEDGDIDKLTAIDFECHHLTGPQYDLAKLLESDDFAALKDKHHLLRQYIDTYNTASQQFNEKVDKCTRKKMIMDGAHFIWTYEYFVIDHVLKSLHNPNYDGPDSAHRRRFWLQRGAQAAQFLANDDPQTESDKLLTLQNIFSKYQLQMGGLTS